jgi:hypothetical protein
MWTYLLYAQTTGQSGKQVIPIMIIAGVMLFLGTIAPISAALPWSFPMVH